MTAEETLQHIAADVAYLAERQRRTEELLTEMAPIAKLAMGAATDELAALEASGWFRFLRAVGKTADRVVATTDEAALDELGRDMIAILDTARTLTRPELLSVVSEAAHVVQDRDALEPMSVVGILRATRDEEVQRGLAVLFELLRHLGRAADVLGASPRPARSTPATAPATGALADTARRPSRMDEIRARRAAANASGSVGPACSSPRAPGPLASTLDGIGYTADGFLADPKQWTRALAEQLAAASSIELTDAHWALVTFARNDWEATGVSPNIRRLSTGANVSTRDIYTLFKKAPGKTIARIAGIPKPAGCI